MSYIKAIIMTGLSGSGKSFVAKLISENFNYEWIRSDVIRKKIMGISPEAEAKADFGKGIYAREITFLVYNIMIVLGKECIKKGKGVVLDATFIEDWQRNLVRNNFSEYIFIHTVAPEEVIKLRLENRRDVSDATYSVYLKQKERWKDIPEAIRIDTNKPAEIILQELKSLIK